MKTTLPYSLVVLAFILQCCSAEKKEIKGVWIDQDVSNADIHYIFERDGTYTHVDYGPDSSTGKGKWVFRNGSIGYYRHIGNRAFNLYQIDIDVAAVVGLPVSDQRYGTYLNKALKSSTEPDYDSILPSYLAQIQGDGDSLHILHNDDVVIKLKRKHIKFGDKR